MHKLFRKQWPVPYYDESDQPHFLFILTPPFSGSTALAQLINSSCRSMLLHEKGEGQWLIPGLCRSDRWHNTKKVNYTSVKAVWLAQYQQVKTLVQNVDVVIEKSPPNMMRIEPLLQLFNNYSMLANNRNPYANCSSALYRQYKGKSLNEKQRISTLEQLAKDWLVRSEQIHSLVQKFTIPLITYEQFCESPDNIFPLLQLPEPVLESIDPKAEVKVKDYKKQGINNQNDKQIALLNRQEIDCISEVLQSHQSLLSFFGYQINQGKPE